MIPLVLCLLLLLATPVWAIDASLSDFSPVLRASDIAVGLDTCGDWTVSDETSSTGYQAITMGGATTATSNEWLTIYRPTGGAVFSGSLTLDADLCIARNNGTKGAGVVGFYDALTGLGLYIGIHDGGSSDRFTLGVMQPDGVLDTIATLKAGNFLDIHAGSSDLVREQACVDAGDPVLESPVHHIVPTWYRLHAEFAVAGDTLTVTARAYIRDTTLCSQWNLTAPLGSQVGPTFTWSGSLSALGLSSIGEVGIGGYAITATQGTSVASFSVTTP